MIISVYICRPKFFCTKIYKINTIYMNTLLFLGGIGWQEIVIIALVVLLLFGGKKIPELMRGIGSGVRSFKEGLNDVKTEVEKPVNNKKEEE